MKPLLRDIFSRSRVRCVALDATAVVLAVAVGVIAFSSFAHGRLGVGPAQLEVFLSAATAPRTVVELPPFGSVEAPTHWGPVRLGVRLDEIDVVRTTRMIESGALSLPTTMGADAASGLPLRGLSALLWRLIGGGLLAAGLGGTLVALAFRRRRAVVALAIALSVAVPAAAVGTAYATWDIAAFRAPTLRGNLTYAPQLVNIFSTRVADIERLREQAAKVANDLATYYADERSLSSGGALPGTYRVLHVTDLHLDPVGAALSRSLARSYEASLVIDTGDLPILGTPVEASGFAALIDTSVPRLYIPGNHDSPASVAALESLGVTVLASGTVEAGGLRVFGVPDPISRGFGVEPDRGRIEAEAQQALLRLRASLRSGEATPDIVAIHNPQMERPFLGLVPLILSGHTHSARLYVTKGTVRLNSGTLGGMPYDAEASGRRPLPYSASVLYFTVEEPRRLIAVDRISVYSTRSTTVAREVIDESLLP
ncbi:MAG: metallophosphoesterase family protein [Coriobacteriia bacterium]|nr:metallophosphoesterase family protein [Coriobacteriia bacterium]